MKVKFFNLDRGIIGVVKDIGREAARRKIRAYVVGGFVRDLMLKKKNLDIDIVIEGDAIVLAKALAKKKKAVLRVYQQFGTATLEYKDGLHVDLATARKERYPHAGALPVVRAGTLHDDLFRRDFTINAMAAVIHPKGFGELVDTCEGIKDLRKGKIRILHNKSFIDDPTRILRAVRFEQRFNFSMERQTLILLKSALKKGSLQSVKPPRLFAEFRKILKEPHPAKSIRRLHALKGLDFLRKGFRLQLRLLSRIERNISHLSRRSFYKGKKWDLVYLMFLGKGMGKKDMESFVSAFHLTRLEKRVLLASRKIPAITKGLSRKSLSPSQVYQILNPLDEAIICFLRVHTSGNTVGRHIDTYLEKSRCVKLGLTGEDLKRMGVPVGQQIGRILDAILLKKIDVDIQVRSQELQEAKKMRGVCHGTYGKG